MLDYNIDTNTPFSILKIFKENGIPNHIPQYIYNTSDMILDEFMNDLRCLDFSALEIASAMLAISADKYSDCKTKRLVSTLYCNMYMNAYIAVRR